MFSSTQQLSKQNYSVLCPMPVKARYALVFDVETTGLLPKYNPVTREMPELSSYPYIIQFSWVVYDLATNMIETKKNYYIKLPPSIIVTTEITELTGITQDMCANGVELVDVLTMFYYTYLKCDFAVAHNLQFDTTMIMAEIMRNKAVLAPLWSNPINWDIFGSAFTTEKKIHLYCTMVASKDICNIMVESTYNPAQVQAQATVKATSTVQSENTGTIRPQVIVIEPGESLEIIAPISSAVSVQSQKPVVASKPRMYKKFPKLSETHNYLFGYIPDNLHNAIVDVFVCLRCFLKIRCGYSISNRKFDMLLGARQPVGRISYTY